MHPNQVWCAHPLYLDILSSSTKSVFKKAIKVTPIYPQKSQKWCTFSAPLIYLTWYFISNSWKTTRRFTRNVELETIILLEKMTKNSIMEGALNFTGFYLMKCGVVFSFVCLFFSSITAKLSMKSLTIGIFCFSLIRNRNPLLDI